MQRYVVIYDDTKKSLAAADVFLDKNSDYSDLFIELMKEQNTDVNKQKLFTQAMAGCETVKSMAELFETFFGVTILVIIEAGKNVYAHDDAYNRTTNDYLQQDE